MIRSISIAVVAAVLVAFAGFQFISPAVVDIQAPAYAQPGSLVVVSLENCQGRVKAISPSANAIIGQDRVVVTGKAGESVTVIVAAARGLSIDIDYITIEFQNDAPYRPDPVDPAVRDELSDWVRDYAQKNRLSKKTSARVASNFVQAADGSRSVKELQQITLKLNRDLAMSINNDWRQFGKDLKQYLTKTRGVNPTSFKAMRDAWYSVARGLNEYARN